MFFINTCIICILEKTEDRAPVKEEHKLMKKTYLALILSIGIALTACGAQSEEPALFESIPDTSVEGTLDSTVDSTEESSDAELSNETLTSSESVSSEASQKSSASEKAGKDSSGDSTVAATKDASANSSVASSKESSQASASDSSKGNSTDSAAAASTEVKKEEPQKVDYGKILFAGDSRTVDMFDGGTDEIRNVVYNNITVYCKDACQLDYMQGAVSDFGIENFDTLVSWMGCNDYGNFAKYEPFYDDILANGKKLVLCTVGPTDDEHLDIEDKGNYDNARELEYNAALKVYAKKKGIKVIDVYAYIESNPNVYLDPADGIHYQPQPTTAIWNYILSNL